MGRRLSGAGCRPTLAYRVDHSRGEYQGFGFAGIGANRSALSLGMGYLVNENTSFKAEYRLDRASQAVFLAVKSGVYRKTNHLLGASVVVIF